LVELLKGLPADADGARWELANIALEVLVASYAKALRVSGREQPRSTSRQAKLARWQRATRELVASIDVARARLLVDTDFTIYADPQGQVIVTVAGQPLAVTGLGRDDDRLLGAAIVERYCAFNDCRQLLSVDASRRITRPRRPAAQWRIVQARPPEFIVDGRMGCRFENLIDRYAKAEACHGAAQDLQRLRDALASAASLGQPIDWDLLSASRRPVAAGTLLILNATGAYVTVDLPFLRHLSEADWQGLGRRLADESAADSQALPVIDGDRLLTD
jgi:hypothetical protein